jgi:KDO2-lipid IV(A) lauroyltransferase
MICRFQTGRLRNALNQRAKRVGLDLIDADGGKVFLTAIKALKQGRILVTQCDEFDKWRPDPHQDSYFLNCRLPNDRTLGLLSKRSGAPVISALVKREGQKNYYLYLTSITNSASPENVTVSERCLEILETAVEASPEQWYQWKEFGKIIKYRFEPEYDCQEMNVRPLNSAFPSPIEHN